MKASRLTQWIIGAVLLLAIGFILCMYYFLWQKDRQIPPLDEALKNVVIQELVAQKDVKTEEAMTADIHLKRMTEQETWGFGVAVIPAPNIAHTFPDGWLFLARETDEGWQVALEGSDQFARLAQMAPEAIVSPDEKRLFKTTEKVQVTSNTRTGLRLPYAAGQSWVMSGGPHGWSGYERPYSSLDFYGGDERVLAARDGYAYTMCSNDKGWIRIYHDNGYATDYYHLWYNITPSGELISEGTFLGYTGTDVSCGGYANGRHVHFGILQDGNRVALQDKEIGGWVFFEDSAYNGYAMHGSAVHYTGYSLYNYGRLTANQGIVDSYGWSSINLRSGPGSSYPIVGSANDGAIVDISCTATGSSFSGRWGTTNIWNQLTNGQWISDAFVYTGTDGPVAPACNALLFE